ncbi:MAG TPA: MFS transporter [Daejeonella sp.]|nr:MFS transporter [Daejeonella sp.]
MKKRQIKALKTVNPEPVLGADKEKILNENTFWWRWTASFPALQSANYRRYFFGQFISIIGTWLQVVAQGWLVLSLTNSPFYIGLVTALSTVPSLLFSLWGGVIVDNFRKRYILYFTQSASMVLALLLGILTVLQVITLPVICIIAFLLGTVNAVDAPARQAFVSELVNREQLSSAIALNSGIFNGGRIIGPGIAGFLIALAGTGGAFIINGLSYVAVLLALKGLTIIDKSGERNLKPLEAIRQGLDYSFSHPLIRVLLIFIGVVSIFGWSYTTIMPLIARNVFHVDAKGLGYLYSATGLGSLLATYLVGAYAQKVPPLVFIIGGNSLCCIGLILFSFSNTMAVALPLLFFTGLGLLLQTATINTLIQGMVKNLFRGRVMSIYVLMFLGLAPLGNFEIGLLTEKLGTSWAITINAVIVFIFGWVVFFYRKKIRVAYQDYRRLNPPEVV